MTTRTERRLKEKQIRLAEKAEGRRPLVLTKVPKSQWPGEQPGLVEVWLSRIFLVQVFREADGTGRMSVCRTARNNGQWLDGITWEELMRVKRECGRGDCDAVEVYPADRDVVNVANMRHLWFPVESVSFAWRRKA